MKGKKQVFSTAAFGGEGKDEWETPQDLYDWANTTYGPFLIDAAADKDNTLCQKYFTEKDNALIQDWTEGAVFCNPPYSLSPQFIKKAWEQSLLSKHNIVLLIAARTSNKEWHEYIFLHAAEIVFIDGRVKFGNTKAGAPFPSAIVVFNRQKFLANQCTPKLRTHSVRKCKIKPRCKTPGRKKRLKSSPTTQ